MNFLDSSDSIDESIDINITPLIDIVFLLLIFFMVSTTFDQVRGIKVDLPKASNAAKENNSNDLELNIRKDGSLFLGNSATPLAKLQQAIGEKLKTSKDKSLILNADKDARHGLVVEVMDKAKSAGVQKIAIATTEVVNP